MRPARLLPAALLGLWPLAAPADELALVIGTGTYDRLPDLPRGEEMAEAVDGIAALGFEVRALSDPSAAEVAAALAAFLDEAGDADRLLVALSGRFATDGTRSWYLTREAQAPTLFTVDARAVSVESLLQVLARAPSRAVLLLGADPEAAQAFDPWLSEGLGDIAAPQGVTVLVGAPRAAANFLADELAVPRGDLSRLVTENAGITPEGYLPRGFVFAPPAPTGPRPEAALAQEQALWQGAIALDTVEAYENYLRAYPQGRYAAQARQGIAGIEAEPNRAERLAEEALALTRDQRRAIQRQLTLLDFDPRGIDGIFGPATRGAVRNWQQQNGFPQTGYLDAEQIGRIEAQAARRAAQLEAEAERQRQAAEAADRAAWDAARRADTAAGYGDYIEAFPQGRFAAEARARRDALLAQAAQSEGRAQARAAEEALGLNALTRRVLEQRLAGLGLDPGAVDGTFDGDTRRALRAYQRDRGLGATGFLDEGTLVRLLADTLEQALER